MYIFLLVQLSFCWGWSLIIIFRWFCTSAYVVVLQNCIIEVVLLRGHHNLKKDPLSHGSPPIFPSCQDCMSYCLLLRLSGISYFLPKLLSTENGFLPSLSMWLCFLLMQNHIDRLGRETFIMPSSLGRKHEITDSLEGTHMTDRVGGKQ